MAAERNDWIRPVGDVLRNATCGLRSRLGLDTSAWIRLRAEELDLSNFYSSIKLWPTMLCGEKSTFRKQCATVVHTALPANGCPLLGLTFAGPGTEIEWISLPELRKP